jgi:hypothetical protein
MKTILIITAIAAVGSWLLTKLAKKINKKNKRDIYPPEKL